ncbi:MAG: hypothetical protein PGN15_11795 [Aeromicrobium erythreum]
MTDAQWLEILVRMVAGEASEEPTEGVLAVRLDEESEALTRFRVRKHGHRWRVDDESGRLWSIQDDRHGYVFDPETDADEPPQRVGRGMSRMHGPVGEALSRPRPIDWVIGGDLRYDDATELAAPPRRTSYLGQDVWEVRLVLPGRRGEMRFLVDVVDGRTLFSEHDESGILFRWEEVAVVDPHRPELFAWNGPFESGFVTFGEDDDLPEHLAEVLARHRDAEREVVESIPLEDLTVAVRGDVMAFVDESGPGRVRLDWHAQGSFHLFRSPLDDPWDHEDSDGVATSWVDERWRWSVGAVGVAPGAAERLVADLQARTHALSTTPDP